MRAVPLLIAPFVQDHLNVHPTPPRIGERPQDGFGSELIGLNADGAPCRDNGRDDGALTWMTGDEAYGDFRRHGRDVRPRRTGGAAQT